MERHTRQRPGGSPSFLERVAKSVLGNERMERRRWVPARTLPLLAVGVVGAAALNIGGPEREVVVAPEHAEEVDALAGILLPLEVNDRVEKWMRRFMTTDRRTFEVFLSRENIFASLIRGKLRERQMPEDLLYLAMIESGFSTRATSQVGAGGVWQFMSPTARQYGLRVDPWVDERRDPVKATDAALDYLGWLHERYGSWFLAAAAYNAGPGRVDRILKKHADGKKGDEDIYWEIIEHLPKETRDYVPKMLAALTLAQESGRYGFEVEPQKAYEFDRVWVPGGTSLSTVASKVGIELSELRDLNPHLVRSVTPPGTAYGLRVPLGASPRVMAALGGGSRIYVAD
jgi:membrane-bound lytic murein transglycosylase D